MELQSGPILSLGHKGSLKWRLVVRVLVNEEEGSRDVS